MFNRPARLLPNDEVRGLLQELKGTEAAHGRAGILLTDEDSLHVDPTVGLDFVEDLPPVLQEVARRLQADSDEPESARALYHLYTLVRQVAT